MKILHISDTHVQGDTLVSLERLALRLRNYDVVACTGDNVSRFIYQVPESWNKWPQRLKLSVRGTHDKPETYLPLTSWMTQTPWYVERGGLSFIGLDYAASVERQLKKLAESFQAPTRAVVVLSHEWFEGLRAEVLAEVLKEYFSNVPVLFLHGDNHPLGAFWDEKAKLGQFTCYRSNIICCITHDKGVAHLITWDGRGFSCQTVR